MGKAANSTVTILLAGAALALAAAPALASPEAAPQACPGVVTSTPRGTPASEQRATLARMLGDDVPVVVVGDSFGHRWPDEDLRSALGGRPTKLAVGGDRLENTTWMVSQIRPGLHPKAVLIVSGTNNVNHDAACEFDRRLDALLAAVREKFPKTRVYEMNITPKGHGLRAFLPQVRAANAYMREADAAHGIVYVDAFTALAEACAAQSGPECPLIEPDRLHPTPEGFKPLTTALAAAARPASK
jgi:lysophospholipase L1-like esterase